MTPTQTAQKGDAGTKGGRSALFTGWQDERPSRTALCPPFSYMSPFFLTRLTPQPKRDSRFQIPDSRSQIPESFPFGIWNSESGIRQSERRAHGAEIVRSQNLTRLRRNQNGIPNCRFPIPDLGFGRHHLREFGNLESAIWNLNTPSQTCAHGAEMLRR